VCLIGQESKGRKPWLWSAVRITALAFAFSSLPFAYSLLRRQSKRKEKEEKAKAVILTALQSQGSPARTTPGG
jgi:hypothetical protein